MSPPGITGARLTCPACLKRVYARLRALWRAAEGFYDGVTEVEPRCAADAGPPRTEFGRSRISGAPLARANVHAPITVLSRGARSRCLSPPGTNLPFGAAHKDVLWVL